MNRGFGSTGRSRATITGAVLGFVLVLLLTGCAGTTTPTPDDGDGPTIRRRTDRTDRRRDGRSDRGGRKPTDRTKVTPKEQPPDPGPELAKLQEQIDTLNSEKAELEAKIELMKASGEGGNTALMEQLDQLEEEKRQAEEDRATAAKALLDREEQFKEQREALQLEIDDLNDKLNNLGGGQDYGELADKLEKLQKEYGEAQADLIAKETANKGLMSTAAGLRDQKKILEEEKQALETERDEAVAQKDTLEKERVDLLAQNRKLMEDATQAQSERAKEMEDLSKKVDEQVNMAQKAIDDAGAATLKVGEMETEGRKMKVIAFVGLLLGLVAVALAIWLFRESKNIKYQVAFTQAQGGGGVDPAELDSIVSARISEVADNLQVAGGGDLEGLGDRIKQALDGEVKSEEFQNLVKATVIQNAKNAGGGEGGGGLSPEDVKVMVDNQFRAITTYLKNEAVPKMVEDALKRREE